MSDKDIKLGSGKPAISSPPESLPEIIERSPERAKELRGKESPIAPLVDGLKERGDRKRREEKNSPAPLEGKPPGQLEGGRQINGGYDPKSDGIIIRTPGGGSFPSQPISNGASPKGGSVVAIPPSGGGKGSLINPPSGRPPKPVEPNPETPVEEIPFAKVMIEVAIRQDTGTIIKNEYYVGGDEPLKKIHEIPMTKFYPEIFWDIYKTGSTPNDWIASVLYSVASVTKDYIGKEVVFNYFFGAKESITFSTEEEFEKDILQSTVTSYPVMNLGYGVYQAASYLNNDQEADILNFSSWKVSPQDRFKGLKGTDKYTDSGTEILLPVYLGQQVLNAQLSFKYSNIGGFFLAKENFSTTQQLYASEDEQEIIYAELQYVLNYQRQLTAAVESGVSFESYAPVFNVFYSSKNGEKEKVNADFGVYQVGPPANKGDYVYDFDELKRRGYVEIGSRYSPPISTSTESEPVFADEFLPSTVYASSLGSKSLYAYNSGLSFNYTGSDFTKAASSLIGKTIVCEKRIKAYSSKSKRLKGTVKSFETGNRWFSNVTSLNGYTPRNLIKLNVEWGEEEELEFSWHATSSGTIRTIQGSLYDLGINWNSNYQYCLKDKKLWAIYTGIFGEWYERIFPFFSDELLDEYIEGVGSQYNKKENPYDSFWSAVLEEEFLPFWGQCWELTPNASTGRLDIIEQPIIKAKVNNFFKEIDESVSNKPLSFGPVLVSQTASTKWKGQYPGTKVPDDIGDYFVYLSKMPIDLRSGIKASYVQ